MADINAVWIYLFKVRLPGPKFNFDYFSKCIILQSACHNCSLFFTYGTWEPLKILSILLYGCWGFKSVNDNVQTIAHFRKKPNGLMDLYHCPTGVSTILPAIKSIFAGRVVMWNLRKPWRVMRIKKNDSKSKSLYWIIQSLPSDW